MKSKDKQYYRELRELGLRKRVARRLSDVERTGTVTKKQRRAISGLAAAVAELQRNTGAEERSADQKLAVSDIRGVSVKG